MPTYTLRSPRTGETREVTCPASERPHLDERVRIGRRVFVRVFDRPHATVMNYEHDAVQMPRSLAKHARHVAPSGRPACTSKADIKELEARTGWRYER